MTGALGLPAWAWATALLFASGCYTTLLARLRMREQNHPAWWLGYARDGANVAGAALYFGAVRLCGFAGPPSLAIAVALLLVTYGLDWLCGKKMAWRRAQLAAIAGTMLLGIAVTLGGARVEKIVAALVAVAQPR